MAQRRKASSPLDPPREVEARMGQYLAAFGSGAGDAHVPRKVVDFLRARYLPFVKERTAAHPDAWKTEGAHVLALMRGVGRLAASLALARGDIAISPGDARTACVKVEAAEQQVRGNTGNCPPLV